jgi:hypothetical protein
MSLVCYSAPDITDVGRCCDACSFEIRNINNGGQKNICLLKSETNRSLCLGSGRKYSASCIMHSYYVVLAKNKIFVVIAAVILCIPSTFTTQPFEFCSKGLDTTDCDEPSVTKSVPR